jgi:hypothetical protein
MFGIELERMNLNGVLIEQTSSHLRDFAFEEFGQPCLLEDAALKNKMIRCRAAIGGIYYKLICTGFRQFDILTGAAVRAEGIMALGVYDSHDLCVTIPSQIPQSWFPDSLRPALGAGLRTCYEGDQRIVGAMATT